MKQRTNHFHLVFIIGSAAILAQYCSPLMAENSNLVDVPTDVPTNVPVTPCMTAEYEQFSFWLGKWTAHDQDGLPLGTNHIHRILGHCAIQENWRSRGFEGTSYNFYNAATGQWHQSWIDNSGGNLLLKGGLVGTRMQMSGDRKTLSGKLVTDRITWTPLEDGRVHQHWQASPDGGKTWNDVFDGYYSKDK